MITPYLHVSGEMEQIVHFDVIFLGKCYSSSWASKKNYYKCIK